MTYQPAPLRPLPEAIKGPQLLTVGWPSTGDRIHKPGVIQHLRLAAPAVQPRDAA